MKSIEEFIKEEGMNNIIRHIQEFVKEGGKIYYNPKTKKLIFRCTSPKLCEACWVRQISWRCNKADRITVEDIKTWKWNSFDNPAFCVCKDLMTQQIFKYILYMGIPVTETTVFSSPELYVVER